METSTDVNLRWVSNCCGRSAQLPEEGGHCPKCKDNCTFVVLDDEGNELLTYEL
jgi:hypothetical protein